MKKKGFSAEQIIGKLKEVEVLLDAPLASRDTENLLRGVAWTKIHATLFFLS
jgi:hypothetical protein